MVDVLLFVAIVAFHDTFFFVDDGKEGVHGLVVGDALGVVALDDAVDLIGCDDHFLFHHLVVFDDVEHHVGRDDRQSADFLVGKIFIGDLDDAFFSEPFRDGR